MKYKDEDPDNLGGLGGMLPAEVLKMLNELLERTHQADCKQHGSIVFNIYEKGSMHIDHVDKQNFYGNGCGVDDGSSAFVDFLILAHASP